MKILYDSIYLNKNFDYYNEYYFLTAIRNEVKKKGYLKKKKYVIKQLINILLAIFYLILMVNAYKSNIDPFLNIFAVIIIIYSGIVILFYVFSIIMYFISGILFFKKQCLKKKNCLIVNEIGISDITYSKNATVKISKNISCKWNQLTYILVGKHYIMVTTDSDFIYVFPIDIKDRFISSINKFNNNKKLKVIEEKDC